MIRGWLLASAVPAALGMMVGPARAVDEPSGCPPGEWFCDDAEGDAPLDESDSEAPRDAFGWYSPEQDDAAPGERVDVRRPAPSPLLERGWSEGSGGRPSSPWSMALRVQGVLLDGKRQDTGMGGVGVSGRYNLGHDVRLDLGLDSILGTDYHGNDRSELSLSLSSFFFLNDHPVVRTYVLVGFNAASARVGVASGVQTWGYFGGHTGLGVEISLDPRIALNFDILGFMRGRTDSRAAREPEFTDGQGRVTNTAGGGLLRAGVVLRF